MFFSGSNPVEAKPHWHCLEPWAQGVNFLKMREFSEFPVTRKFCSFENSQPSFPPTHPHSAYLGTGVVSCREHSREREKLLIGILLPQPCSPPHWMPLNADIHGEHTVFLEGFLPPCERFQLSPPLLPEGASLPQLEILLYS